MFALLLLLPGAEAATREIKCGVLTALHAETASPFNRREQALSLMAHRIYFECEPVNDMERLLRDYFEDWQEYIRPKLVLHINSLT